MKIIVIFLVIIVSSPSLFARNNQEDIIDSVNLLKAINAQLLIRAGDKTINKLLETKVFALEQLMDQLREAVDPRLMFIDVKNDQGFLESRIKINQERGNDLAVQRDKLQLKTRVINQSIRQYLEYLIESSNNYQPVENIVNRSQKELDVSLQIETKLVLPDVEVKGGVFIDVKKNYQSLLLTNDSYQDVLNYVINNPERIASVSWFQRFSLLSVISYINHFDLVRLINNKLARFKVDTGGLVISFLIISLIYLSYPFVFNCTRWCVENYIIDKAIEQQELIYHEIRRPARALLIFFGINLSAYAFFYKTDHRVSLEGFSFVIYSLIYIWLFFKIIDSIVLVQIQKLASLNKELRKELFNLGVQIVKGLVVVIILAFGLSHFGISLTAIMSTLGVGGLAFALAAKDTLSNLFGGVTILFDNIFRMGDWIKIGNVEGTVAEIGLRSTTIRTFDNALITIPNSVISVSNVMNWNRRAVGRRIKMYIGVTYESDMGDIRQAIVDIRDMLSLHSKIANPRHKVTRKRRDFKFSSQADTHGIKSTQLVFMDRYSDFSIDILIYCFAKTVDWEEWLAVKEDVLFKIAEILKKNNLEFAYPTQVRINRLENEASTSVLQSIEPLDGR